MKPNFTFPLAPSYDQRFPLGDAGAQAGYDQRKVNCFYELVRNAVSGKGTLFLSKRPGPNTGTSVDDYGTDTQVPYLVQSIGPSGAMPLLIVKDGDNTNAIYPVSEGVTASGGISTDADYAPVFSTAVNISGTVNYVVQLKKEDSGVGTQKAYYSTDWATWTQISDSDFTAIVHRGKIVPLDGTHYIAGANGIHGSDLNSISAWSASNVVPSSVQQDYMQGIIPFADRLLLLGEETCQSYYNAGNKTGSPLRRVSAKVDRVGLSARFASNTNHGEYYCTVANRLFFLGRDSSSWHSLSLMTYNGGVFERVSGIAEERLMADSGTYGIWPVTHHGESAVGIMLTVPGASSARWLMFYPEHKSWFEWESDVYTAINSGTFFAGVSDPQALYTFDITNNWDDAGTNYTFLTQFRMPHDDDSQHFMSRYGVQGDTVSGLTLDVAFNDGGAATYESAGSIDMSVTPKELYGGGMYNERYVRISNTSDKQIRLRNFNANVT